MNLEELVARFKAKQIADGMFGKHIPGTFDSALPKKNCNKKY